MQTRMSSEDDSDFYKICLKAHGYTFHEDQTDEDKSESDEESRSMKPPPVPYRQFQHRIVNVPDTDAETSKVNKTKIARKHNVFNKNKRKSKVIAAVNDNVKIQAGNKTQGMQEIHLNKNNYINAAIANTLNEPMKNYWLDNKEFKVNKEPMNSKIFEQTQTQITLKAKVPDSNYLFENSQNIPTHTPSMTTVPCITSCHENISIITNVLPMPKQNVGNLSNQNGNFNVKSTAANWITISKKDSIKGQGKYKSSEEPAIVQVTDVSRVNQSQVQITTETQIPMNSYSLEKSENTSYHKLPSMSTVPYYDRLEYGNIEGVHEVMPRLKTSSDIEISIKDYPKKYYQPTKQSVGNLSNQNGNFNVKSTAANWITLSKKDSIKGQGKYKSSEEPAIVQVTDVSRVNQSQVQITTETQIPMNSYSLEKSENTSYHKLPSMSTVPYYDRLEYGNIEGVHEVMPRLKTSSDIEISIKDYPKKYYQPTKQSAIRNERTAHKGNQSQIQIKSRTTVGKNSYSLEKDKSTSHQKLMDISVVPHNRFGYGNIEGAHKLLPMLKTTSGIEIPIKYYISTNTLAIQNERSTGSSIITVPYNCSRSSNMDTANKATPLPISNAAADVDLVFMEFQMNRENILKNRKKMCVVM